MSEQAEWVPCVEQCGCTAAPRNSAIRSLPTIGGGVLRLWKCDGCLAGVCTVNLEWASLA
jgi:hypothetical protein